MTAIENPMGRGGRNVSIFRHHMSGRASLLHCFSVESTDPALSSINHSPIHHCVGACDTVRAVMTEDPKLQCIPRRSPITLPKAV